MDLHKISEKIELARKAFHKEKYFSSFPSELISTFKERRKLFVYPLYHKILKMKENDSSLTYHHHELIYEDCDDETFLFNP